MTETHTLTKSDIEAIAELAAKKANRETFQLLGVDLGDQRSVNEFRADLVYARSLRKLADGTKAKIWFIIITGLAIAVFSALGRGAADLFKEWIGK